MVDLTALSPAKLHKEIAKRESVYRASLDSMIKAGLGDMRGTDIKAAARGDALLSQTALCREYLAARDAYKDAADELDRRKRYHGSDKRTPRAA